MATKKKLKQLNVQNVETIQKLVKILSTGRPKTTAEVMTSMRCAKPTAYRRIQWIKQLGLEVKEVPRERGRGEKGPEAIAYRIVPNKQSRSILTERAAG